LNKLIITFLILLLFVLRCSSSNGVQQNQGGQEKVSGTLTNSKIIAVQESTLNVDSVKNFFDNFNRGQKVKFQVTKTTDEGDPIFHSVEFDGKTIKYTVDNTKDKFAGNGRGITTNEFLNIVKENEQNKVTYYLIDTTGNKHPFPLTLPVTIDYATFISALREKGYSVEELKEQQTSPNGHQLLSVQPKVIKVDGENVSIYEFTDSDTAKSQSQTISSDGSMFGGGGIIEWKAPPHFYLQGRIIVGYIGSNQGLLNNLVKIIGNPITTT
jgi:hypothetical protein